MKKLAQGSETVVRIPPVLKPVEVEVTLRNVPVEISHVAVAIGVLPENVQSITYATTL